MFRKKNRALACAIAGMGMLASTAASALTIDLAFTADNVVNSWWVVNQADSTVVNGGVLSTASTGSGSGYGNNANGWQKVSLQSVNDLTVGDYYVVFGATNNATPTGSGNPAGFLAEISGANLSASSQLLTSSEWLGGQATHAQVTAAQTPGNAFVPSLPTVGAVQYESNASSGGTWPIIDGIASNAHWIWANLGGAAVAGSSAWLMAEITVVPIPAAGVLFVSAIAGLVVLGRRRLRAGQEALPA